MTEDAAAGWFSRAKDRLPRLAYEWFLVTRAFGTSGPYLLEENVRRDASQWTRYLLYQRRVIRMPAKLIETKGDWSGEDFGDC